MEIQPHLSFASEKIVVIAYRRWGDKTSYLKKSVIWTGQNLVS